MVAFVAQPYVEAEDPRIESFEPSEFVTTWDPVVVGITTFRPVNSTAASGPAGLGGLDRSPAARRMPTRFRRRGSCARRFDSRWFPVGG